MTPALLAGRLRAAPIDDDPDGQWPTMGWLALREAGVPRWTIPADFGGDGGPTDEILDGCIELARWRLTPTFVLSQFQSAVARIVASANAPLKGEWLPRLAAGDAFTTVGISHLTTSRQHQGQPAVAATPVHGGYRVSGEIPWVTAAGRADVIVAGATLDDGRQILFALPRESEGATIDPPWTLLALTGSETGPVRLRDVFVPHARVLDGPRSQVLQSGGTAGAGSLTTSALALGHALGCLDRLQDEAARRETLKGIVAAFDNDAAGLWERLLKSAGGGETADTPETLRAAATSLALSTSQALLTASKGAGFVAGHPAERLAREAMFFLVWSCPQAVSNRLLREFSGCDEF
ncbi:MAG: acyl-CoA/acyl-ACP dehydrogenase [Planctomyces sp.]|nr:acyl-CoA/acyl-ACP dehydrogenase [Planctomyces sp.]